MASPPVATCSWKEKCFCRMMCQMGLGLGMPIQVQFSSGYKKEKEFEEHAAQLQGWVVGFSRLAKLGELRSLHCIYRLYFEPLNSSLTTLWANCIQLYLPPPWRLMLITHIGFETTNMFLFLCLNPVAWCTNSGSSKGIILVATWDLKVLKNQDAKEINMSGAELWVFQVMMWATVVGVDQTTRPLCFDVIMKPQMFQPYWPMQLRWRILKSRWRCGRAEDSWGIMGRLAGSTGLRGQEEGWCSHHHQQNLGPWAAGSCRYWRDKGSEFRHQMRVGLSWSQLIGRENAVRICEQCSKKTLLSDDYMGLSSVWTLHSDSDSVYTWVIVIKWGYPLVI